MSSYNNDDFARSASSALEEFVNKRSIDTKGKQLNHVGQSDLHNIYEKSGSSMIDSSGYSSSASSIPSEMMLKKDHASVFGSEKEEEKDDESE